MNSVVTGTKLRALRERAGLTVRAVAKLLHDEDGERLAPSTYSDYERASRGAKPLPVWLVQGLLEVLLRRGDPPIQAGEITELGGFPVLSEQMERVVSALERMPEDRRAALLKIILTDQN